MKIIGVESCGECPLRAWVYYETGLCTKASKIFKALFPKKIPQWCPLEDEKEVEHGKE